jgi:hypothetical protein
MLHPGEDMSLILKWIRMWKNFSTIGQRSSSRAALTVGRRALVRINLRFLRELRNSPTNSMWQPLCTTTCVRKEPRCDSNGGSLVRRRSW